MKIDGIEGLEFLDRTFVWSGTEYTYSMVTGISFTATVTSHRVNGIPTGKSYDAQLDVRMPSGAIRIIPKKGWFGALKEAGMEALQHAASAFRQLTFIYRIAPYEAQYAKAGFFDFGGFQFHKDCHVYQAGRQVGRLSGDLTPKLAPFQLTLDREKKGFGARLAAAFVSNNIAIDLTTNRDCMLYMLRLVYGYNWPNEFIPEKRVDREHLFYETVVRFGAMLAKADGDADPRELMQLKRFFSIDDTKVPGAARIFNEALGATLTIDFALGGFAKEFHDSPELKETFLFGMLSVALADGVFHPSEFDLIRKASLRLGLALSAFERILATSGLSGTGFGSSSDSGSSDRGKAESRPPFARTVRLTVLGLKVDASREEISAAYRALVRRYHPDVLMGQGMPRDEIAKAEAILVQINLAYEGLMEDAA